MSRGDLERLSKNELIELVLKLQRPVKTSRTSSKPPSTDRKERREQSRPGGAKPGHEGHSRVAAEDPDAIVDHRPTACPDCGLALSPDLPAETVSVHERIELPEVKPLVEQHRRLAAVCPGCRARVSAPRPTGAASTPIGSRLHATAVYLKTFQALSYERLQNQLAHNLLGLRSSSHLSILKARKPYIGLDHFRGGGAIRQRYQKCARAKVRRLFIRLRSGAGRPSRAALPDSVASVAVVDHRPSLHPRSATVLQPWSAQLRVRSDRRECARSRRRRRSARP